MPPLPTLPLSGRLYVAGISTLGVLVVSSALLDLVVSPVGAQWFVLVALTLISGSATVKLPSIPASISVSEAFVFTAALLYGASAATVLVALDGLVISYWMSRHRREMYRALFNMSAPALSVWCSAHFFFFIAGVQPLSMESTTLGRILIPLFLFSLSYFVLNSGLIAIAVKAETHLPVSQIWYNNFLWLSLNYFCGASVAVLIVPHTRDIDIRYVGLVLPLLLVLYFTFKTSMGRVEDANRHVEEVHHLYLSTVETLAMAIDAKDQVTHGHIRRVQLYAVRLASALGVKDEQLLKAIEAAALLHDMGKLAIPERILNKPGKLTAAEFETMKSHAGIGADILSSIEFPYPVVPIVRHHHENWNGTGYPAGLVGTDIPIGARILAVADCFDALTSDRPYRPRLPDSEAESILLSRRGTMYDPFVVDTFVGILSQVKPEIDLGTSQRRALPTSSSQSPLVNDCQVVPNPSGQSGSSGSPEVVATLDLASTCIRSIVPHAISILYRNDTASHLLFPIVSRNDRRTSHRLHKQSISVGTGVSGWVAANLESIVNSEAVLDFTDSELDFATRLTWCLSTPVIGDGRLLGVWTLYSDTKEQFTNSHRRIVESFSQMLAALLATRTGDWNTTEDVAEPTFDVHATSLRRII